ncbi:MAG: hypothetical protein JSS43_29525 [Proteobacteria bacterium]|nr:hypothetical protein [Pseudomonadota bacterium]
MPDRNTDPFRQRIGWRLGSTSIKFMNAADMRLMRVQSLVLSDPPVPPGEPPVPADPDAPVPIEEPPQPIPVPPPVPPEPLRA